MLSLKKDWALRIFWFDPIIGPMLFCDGTCIQCLWLIGVLQLFCFVNAIPVLPVSTIYGYCPCSAAFILPRGLDEIGLNCKIGSDWIELDEVEFGWVGFDKNVLEYLVWFERLLCWIWILAWVFLNSLDIWEILLLTLPRNSNWILLNPSLPSQYFGLSPMLWVFMAASSLNMKKELQFQSQ